VTLATLAGADDLEAAGNLLALIPALAGPAARRRRSATVKWLGGLYGGGPLIAPVRPDRLGEALVASTLSEEDDGGHGLLAAVLRLPDDRQLARALDLLARLVTTNPAMLGVVAGVLFGCHPELAERATRQARGAAGRPGSLDIALALQRIYSHALADRLTELASAAGDDGAALLGLALSYNRTGDLAADSGRSDLATDLYLRALTIRARLWIRHHSDRELTRELSISLSRLGDLARRTSQTRDAKKLYERSRRLLSWLVWAEPANNLYASDLATAYDKIAAALAEEGPAEEYYHRGLTIRERLVRENPGEPKFSRDLASSYAKLGDLVNQRGWPIEARGYFEECLEIRERLRAADPTDTTIGRSLSNSYDRLGDWDFDAGEIAAARDRYEKAMLIRQSMSAAEPGNRQIARDLANSYNRLGTVAAGNAEATRLFTEGLQRIKRLADAEPQDATLAQDVSVFLSNLGDVARRDGRPEEAEMYYRLGLDGAQRLLALEPDNITYARDVATFYAGLGSLVEAERAETLLSAAVHFRRHLHDRLPDRTDLAEDLGYALMRLAQVLPPESARRLAVETAELLEPYAAEGRLSRHGEEVWEEARAGC
jgi:tetratricopeptide (TPR) repeat protein